MRYLGKCARSGSSYGIKQLDGEIEKLGTAQLGICTSGFFSFLKPQDVRVEYVRTNRKNNSKKYVQ